MDAIRNTRIALMGAVLFLGAALMASAQININFAGERNAVDYAYGWPGVAFPALNVSTGNFATGAATITLVSGMSVQSNGNSLSPLAINAPITVGIGANAETVTPTAVSGCNLPATVVYQCQVTATFANIHGAQEPVISATFGLQEAVNSAASNSGGIVIVGPQWSRVGGTSAIISAAVIIGPVTIQDNRTGVQYFDSKPSTLTQLAAPAALTTVAGSSGVITTAGTGGTIPASSTYRLGVTYVDINGGETTISTDSASTSTIASSASSTNTISVTSPPALTGAVGYRLYMTAASGSSLAEILYTPTCTLTTLETVMPACAIGATSTITAIVTGTATVPATNNAYATVVSGIGGIPTSMLGSFPPFTNVATIAAAGTGTLGVVNLPAGFLNSIGKTVRICGNGFGTTNATPGTLTVAAKLFSVPGVTSITPFTAVSGTTTASAVVSFNFCTTWSTLATGTTGTLEAHGYVQYNLAGTAVSSTAQDIIVAASSTVDLTKQDQIDVTMTPATTAITTGGAQLRQLTVEVLN